jgi:hypothetical protein
VPGVLPAAGAMASLAVSCGLQVERVSEFTTADSRWLLIGPHGRRDLDAALAKLETTHRIQTAALRRI